MLDKERGPLLLEMNARPGLSIQIANKAGLIPRLEQVDSQVKQLKAVEEKIEFAKRHFASRHFDSHSDRGSAAFKRT